MYKYVTIEREYGSAGTEIATKLAKECKIPCYGREILEELSRKAGMTATCWKNTAWPSSSAALRTCLMRR